MTDDPARNQLHSLGSFIRARRQQAELTLRELSERANVSNPYLSQIERGLHEPSVRVLKAIAGALEVSGESLLRQAGLLDPDVEEADLLRPSSVEAAVEADETLDDAAKETLLAVYRSLQKQQ